MERSSVGLRAMVGRGLGLLGVICAAVGIFVLNGIAIEFAGIMLGRIGLLLLPDQRRQGGADPRDRRGGPQRRFHSRIREDCPFLVQDVLFNALLCQADKDLAQIARALGEDGAFFEERAERTAHAMNEKLWDAEHSIYLDFDLVAQRLIYVYVVPNFVPLFAGIPNEGQARRMVGVLEDAGFGLSDEGVIPVPGYDRYGFAFFPTRYWRGPVWINSDWFLAQGLDRYGYREHAGRLQKTIVSLCNDEGFYEYFDPLTGKGRGSDLFSWTAALFLDVMRDDPRAAAQPGQGRTNHSPRILA